MSEVFGKEYAKRYDAVHRAKPYDEECALIERLVSAHGSSGGRRVLDLGCGTGGHALALARRGYQVTGVDTSSAMLRQAEQKASALSGASRPRFVEGDMQHLALPDRFDVCVMMYAVLGYQLENDAALRTLAAARQHLDPGGLVLGDVWFGPAVLQLGHSSRVARVQVEDGELIRESSGESDLLRQISTVEISLREAEAPHREVARERHSMRHFFPKELELLLTSAGFELVRFGAFPEVERPPDASTWNVMFVGKATRTT